LRPSELLLTMICRNISPPLSYNSIPHRNVDVSVALPLSITRSPILPYQSIANCCLVRHPLGHQDRQGTVNWTARLQQTFRTEPASTDLLNAPHTRIHTSMLEAITEQMYVA